MIKRTTRSSRDSINVSFMAGVRDTMDNRIVAFVPVASSFKRAFQCALEMEADWNKKATGGKK